MRWLTLALVTLVGLLQYPLWVGKGGWLKVWDASVQLRQQRDANRQLEARNAGLDAEVRDLKQGYDAIEERARYELGMIRQDEVFVQLPERTPKPGDVAPSPVGPGMGRPGAGNTTPPNTRTAASPSRQAPPPKPTVARSGSVGTSAAAPAPSKPKPTTPAPAPASR